MAITNNIHKKRYRAIGGITYRDPDTNKQVDVEPGNEFDGDRLDTRSLERCIEADWVEEVKPEPRTKTKDGDE